MQERYLNTGMNESLRQLLVELRRQLETLYEGRLARLMLYGSQARGESESGSDIDILVVLDGQVIPTREVHRTSEIIAKLSLKYDVVVSCLFMEQERAINERSPLLLNIRREGIPI